MIDGMLAVSAQCGCCHQFHTFCVIILCPFMSSVFWYHFVSLSSFSLLLVCFLFCCMFSSFAKSILLMILHGLLFCYFLFLLLYGVCVMGIIDYILVGGSYSSVYVPPPMYVFPVVLVVYIAMFFFFLQIIFCMPISYYTFTPGFCSCPIV